MVARGALIAIALGACRDTPSTAELDELRAEAVAANEAALAKERERAPTSRAIR